MKLTLRETPGYGEAKRRQEAQARGISVPPNCTQNSRFNVRLNDRIWQTRLAFRHYCSTSGNMSLIMAQEKTPLLAEIWFRMVAFAELAKEGAVSKSEAEEFWRNYWEYDLVKVLGQVDIRRDESYFFLTRIKGAGYAAVEFLALNVVTSEQDCNFLEKACSQRMPIGELTLEIGLHFHNNDVLYWGENLLINKGKDTASEKGELMISVRHSSNCWNCYPSPDNLRVSLSEYKKAKSVLAQYPSSIRGELVHHKSAKLARMLGMIVEGKYAYLIR